MDRQGRSIRIVIADDHPIFRDGLRRLLETEPDMKVVGEACDGREAVKLATEIKPDILLLDLAMPHHTGLDAIRDLSTNSGAGEYELFCSLLRLKRNRLSRPCSWARAESC